MHYLKRPVVALAAIWLAITGLVSPVSAHDDGGLFQPIIGDFVVEGKATPTGRSVWIRVVDADSGTPAEGVAAAVSTGAGTATLTEVGAGFYTGEVALSPGSAVVTVAIRPVPGGLATRRSTRTWTIDVPPEAQRRVVAGAGRSSDLEAAKHGPAQAARAEGAQRGNALTVQLETVDDRTLASPLYVSLHAKVKVKATGELDPTEYDVYGWAANESGDSTEFVKFRPLDVVDPTHAAGTYGGVVILPHGGKWTMNTDLLALRKHPTDPPIRILTGSLAVERNGPSLQRPGAAEERLSAPKGNLLNTGILALHSLAAAGWGLILVVLAVLGFQRARALSPWARNLAERKLDTLVRAAWLLTGTVYVTGIYNLYRESPYGVPSSWSELRRLLRLPFAGPYYLALGTKLAAYAVLLFASTRLISAARAKARAPRQVTRQTTRTPWAGAADAGAGPRLDPTRGTGPSLSATAVTGTSVMEAPPLAAPAPAPAELGRSFRILLPVMATCGVVIIVCVTILKAAHLLIEVARITS